MDGILYKTVLSATFAVGVVQPARLGGVQSQGTLQVVVASLPTDDLGHRLFDQPAGVERGFTSVMGKVVG